MKKILIGITHLEIGGAERVLVDLVNELSNSYDITLYLLYKGGSLESSLNENIKILYLFNKMNMNIFDKLCFKFNMLVGNKKYFFKNIKLEEYDKTIAFLEGPITHIFSMLKSKKIAFVHTNLDKQYNGLKRKIEIKRNKLSYKNYNDIVFVSNSTLDSFNKDYNINTNKHVIYNYANIENIINKSNAENITLSDNFNFLCVCRVTESKGLMRLLDIHKKLFENNLTHKIYVVGDGPQFNELQDKTKKLNCTDSFILLGKKENPYPYIKACDTFVLPSLYEGYGMVLVEAIILKKQILTTKTGAIEAVKDYPNAIISDNNFDSLYENMKNIISNKDLNCIQYNYTNEKILDDIKTLLDN